MSRIVKRAYKYRFHPTPEQAEELARTFGCVRLVHNKALEERTRAYTLEGRRVSYVESSSRSAFRWRDGRLTLAKMDAPLDIVWSRPLPEGAQPSTVTVSKDAAGRWFVSMLVEEKISPLPPVASNGGIDAGITALATLSSGEKILNSKHERADRRKLAKAQRSLARKEKGSSNRAKARLKVAGVYARIADRRKEYLHKVTTRLVHENQVIAVEDLTVRTMVKNHSLARAICDGSWRELRSMLEYKTAWYGRELVVVDRWFPSSKLCSACGVLQEKMPLGVRVWECACGTVHDRDVNAAKNVLAAGPAES